MLQFPDAVDLSPQAVLISKAVVSRR